jgi:hypothetical protein
MDPAFGHTKVIGKFSHTSAVDFFEPIEDGDSDFGGLNRISGRVCLVHV